MRNNIIIKKMIGYIDKVLSYSADMDYEAFSKSPLTVDACVFNLSQLGELTNKLDKAFISGFPDVPWNEMRGLRNKIVHDYEGVNLKLVWEIVKTDLPQLKNQLQEIQK